VCCIDFPFFPVRRFISTLEDDQKMKNTAVAFCLLLLSLFVVAGTSYAQEGRSEVIQPERFDTMKRPLRDLPDMVPDRVPRGGRDFEPGKPFPVDKVRNVPDPVLQKSYDSSEAAVDPKASSTGVPVDPNNRVAPPDTTGDLGPNHYVQWVNLRYAVYNITRDASNNITGFSTAPGFPKNGNAIWQGFGGSCEADNDGDPLVQYDQAADRWILTQFAVAKSPYMQCVAVSTSGDPTGTYNRYAYSFGTDFNDFPKMGIWGDTYVITYNVFKRGRTFGGSRVCGYERNQMLVGGAARSICTTTSTSYASLLPADVEGTANIAAGSATPILSITSTALQSWRFAVNWAAGTGSLSGPTTVSGVASFSRACGGGTCIPQPGTTNKLDSLGDRLNYRLSYRQFADHEAMVVNHAVTSGSTTGIRWYEFRNASGSTLSNAAPVVFQQGTFSPDSTYRWMGSAAMDRSGNIAIGYNVSSSTVAPSIRYAFRSAGDPSGTLGTETNIFGSGGTQTGTLARWGDYSTISVDPVGGCSMVFTTEYIPTNGNFNWSTYISSFKLSTCQ
jgi:hypothetical protein